MYAWAYQSGGTVSKNIANPQTTTSGMTSSEWYNIRCRTTFSCCRTTFDFLSYYFYRIHGEYLFTGLDYWTATGLMNII